MWTVKFRLQSPSRVSGAPHRAYASATLSISADSRRLRRNPHIRNRETVNAPPGGRPLHPCFPAAPSRAVSHLVGSGEPRLQIPAPERLQQGGSLSRRFEVGAGRIITGSLG